MVEDGGASLYTARIPQTTPRHQLGKRLAGGELASKSGKTAINGVRFNPTTSISKNPPQDLGTALKKRLTRYSQRCNHDPPRLATRQAWPPGSVGGCGDVLRASSKDASYMGVHPACGSVCRWGGLAGRGVLVRLLPCPFCGGDNIHSADGFVRCNDCVADGPFVPRDELSRQDKSIERWNTRTPSPTTTGEQK